MAEALATSTRGFDWLCDNTPDFPSSSTGWRWRHENAAFREMIERAKEQQAERVIYGGLQVLEDVDPADGQTAVVAAKNIADYRMKMAPKLAPRTMGDRQKVQLGGDPDSPPVASVNASVEAPDLPDDEREAFLALIHKGLQRGDE